MDEITMTESEFVREFMDSMGEIGQNGKFVLGPIASSVFASILEIHMREFAEQNLEATLAYDRTRSWRYDNARRYSKHAEAAIKHVLSRLLLGYSYDEVAETALANINALLGKAKQDAALHIQNPSESSDGRTDKIASVPASIEQRATESSSDRQPDKSDASQRRRKAGTAGSRSRKRDDKNGESATVMAEA